MADDITTRLRGCAWDLSSLNGDTSCLVDAADQIERLRHALALAVGELSTHGPYLYTSPDQLMESFLKEADRG